MTVLPLIKLKHRFFKDRFLKERFSVGLDIGSAAIKLVKLRFFKDAVELCGFALQPNSGDLTAALKEIRQSQEVTKVNLSVSGPAAIVRYVNFPKMSAEELKQALKFEAQKHLPFSIEEVNFDSFILKDNLTENKILVLLAAVKKELINQRLKLIAEAGLKADTIDLDAVALVNAFNFNYPQLSDDLSDKSIALLNIGAELSNLSILEAGSPRLSRDIHLQKVAEVSELALSNLATETRVSFDYYESQSALSVAKIFLSGGGSQISGLKDMLANQLGIEVEFWDPFKKINVSGGLDADKIKASSAQLAVAVGLALRQ